MPKSNAKLKNHYLMFTVGRGSGSLERGYGIAGRGADPAAASVRNQIKQQQNHQ